jgi:cysteine-rich repeat protein
VSFVARSARLATRTPFTVWLVVAVLSTLVGCSASDAPPAVGATAVVCGNAVRESGEECDDGNENNEDGCLETCQLPVSWTTSDPHVHGAGCSQQVTPSELAAQLQRQQIQVGAALVWGGGYGDTAFFTGRDHPVSTSSFLLHYDLEISRFAAAKSGHLILLGLDSLAFSRDVFDVPHSGVPVVEWAREQPRAVVGMAHAQFWPSDGSYPVPPGGCCVPWEAVVHAARGRLDFLSMEWTWTAGPGTFVLWRALQNAGFRVAIAGGSDWSCISERFDSLTPRTDAIIDGPLSYEGWLSAIKAGRTATAVGIGNHVNLRVEGRRLGEEVHLAAPRDVAVSLEIAGKGGDVEILVNGEVASRVAIPAGNRFVQERVPISRSSWIAARSPYVLTSPVYVLVEDRPVRAAPADMCYLWRSVEHLSQLVATRRLRLYESEGEALAAYQEAVAELRRRFAESGGDTCPG